jgi:hypothetical protein
MCIAIYKPENIIISKETLEQCFKSNPDGAGFMYGIADCRKPSLYEDEDWSRELQVKKGFFTFESFWEEYEPYQNKQCVIHFRIASHGEVNIENCHPFFIADNLAFVHNGMLPGYNDHTKNDTQQFNEDYLKPLSNICYNDDKAGEAIKSLIEYRIGNNNKLITLDSFGNYKIYNEHKGVWDGGVWYSNTSYKIYKPSPFKRNTKHIPVEVGGLVELTKPITDKETGSIAIKGDILEIISINKGFKVDLIGETGFFYDVSYAAFNMIQDVEPTLQYEESTFDFYNHIWNKYHDN